MRSREADAGPSDYRFNYSPWDGRELPVYLRNAPRMIALAPPRSVCIVFRIEHVVPSSFASSRCGAVFAGDVVVAPASGGPRPARAAGVSRSAATSICLRDTAPLLRARRPGPHSSAADGGDVPVPERMRVEVELGDVTVVPTGASR